MIKGRKRQAYTLLNKENILNRVSEVDIIIAFWPSSHRLKWNRAISSPFRQDDFPSFIIGNKFGNITYKDLGDYNFRGDVWQFVKQIENLCSFQEVLEAIDRKFMLGLSKGEPRKDKSPVITWEAPRIELKPPPFIQVVTRKFNKLELDWWAQYEIDIEDLKEAHIYAPKELYRNRRRLPNTELTFCYYYPEIEKWKIYRPLVPKKKGMPVHQLKWDTNLVPFDYVEHLDKIKNCEVAIITKSRKDRLVLKKALGINCICITNAEDPSCLSEEAIQYLKENSQTQVTVSDNDKKGKEFSWYLTNQHGFRHCNVPNHYLDQGISDFADLAKTKGLQAVREHFLSKGIIHSLKQTA